MYEEPNFKPNLATPLIYFWISDWTIMSLHAVV